MKYLAHYPDRLVTDIAAMLAEGRLGAYLLDLYGPAIHAHTTDTALFDFAMHIKNTALRQSPPVSKVVYDGKIHIINDALGLHTFVSRVQGGRLKAKNEIRIASLFRTLPEPFLRMIVVHELAHLREKEHSKAFYQLCMHMEPRYPRIEFDLRVYLTYRERFGPLWRHP